MNRHHSYRGGSENRLPAPTYHRSEQTRPRFRKKDGTQNVCPRMPVRCLSLMGLALCMHLCMHMSAHMHAVPEVNLRDCSSSTLCWRQDSVSHQAGWAGQPVNSKESIHR